MKKSFAISAFILLSLSINAQDTITLMESTINIKARSTEEFCYGFAAGDKIVLSIKELDDKEIGQITVSKEPNQVLYNGIKEKSVNKTIPILDENVYIFSITNTSILKKNTLKIIIQRIPSTPATRTFNTSWEWKTVYDTAYTSYEEDSLVRHDTIVYSETVKELVSKTNKEVTLIDRTENVKSKGIVVHDNPRSSIEVVLPKDNITDLKREKVIAWGYWIAVGENAHNIWNNVLKAGTAIGSACTGGIAGILLSGASNIELPTTPEKVHYAITDKNNSLQFMSGNQFNHIQKGYGSGGYGLIEEKNLSQQRFYINLYNENLHERINVVVKASAIIMIEEYEYKTYNRQRIKPIYTKVRKTRMNISERRIRVNSK